MKRVGSWAVLFGAFAGGCAAGSADSALEQDGGSGVNASDALAPGDDGNPPEAAATNDASTSDGAEHDAGMEPKDASILDAGIDSDPPFDSAPGWDAPPSPDATPPFDATPPPVDLARSGTAYTWQSMTSKTADTGKLPAPALNDGSLSTQVNIDSSSGDVANAWEGAGVIFGSPVTVASVTFVQGKTGTSSGDGWFEANFGLQTSADGTTWTDCAWSATPAYAYSSAVSGKSFTFTGAAISGLRGVRVVGQVNTAGSSWWEAADEVIVFGP